MKDKIFTYYNYAQGTLSITNIQYFIHHRGRGSRGASRGNRGGGGGSSGGQVSGGYSGGGRGSAGSQGGQASSQGGNSGNVPRTAYAAAGTAGGGARRS